MAVYINKLKKKKLEVNISMPAYNQYRLFHSAEKSHFRRNKAMELLTDKNRL